MASAQGYRATATWLQCPLEVEVRTATCRRRCCHRKAQAHTLTHTHNTHACTHMQTDTNTHANMCANIHTHAYTHINTHIQVDTPAHAHECTLREITRIQILTAIPRVPLTTGTGECRPHSSGRELAVISVSDISSTQRAAQGGKKTQLKK